MISKYLQGAPRAYILVAQ